MKKIIYLSIVLMGSTLTFCRYQDDLVHKTDVKSKNASNASAANNYNSTNYAIFDSSSYAQGDPVKPPQD